MLLVIDEKAIIEAYSTAPIYLPAVSILIANGQIIMKVITTNPIRPICR